MERRQESCYIVAQFLIIKNHTHNPGQNSWNTNAIARANEVFSLLPTPPPPQCSVDVRHITFVSSQSTLLGGNGGSRNGLL